MNLTEVLSQDGKVIETQEVLAMDNVEVQNGTFPILKKSPVSLVITNTGKKKLSIKGSADVAVQIPCDRCLEDVQVDISIEIDRDVSLDESEETKVPETEEMTLMEMQGITEAEESGISGYTLDVEQLIRSELLVNWPMKTLCTEECKGICKKCGSNQNEGNCSCDTVELDPRMAVIQDIFKNNKEV